MQMCPGQCLRFVQRKADCCLTGPAACGAATADPSDSPGGWGGGSPRLPAQGRLVVVPLVVRALIAGSRICIPARRLLLRGCSYIIVISIFPGIYIYIIYI